MVSGNIGRPVSISLYLSAIVLVGGCSPAPEDTDSVTPNQVSSEARALVEVQEVPSSIGCIRITVLGSDRSSMHQFDTVPGERASLSLSGLPTGNVTFTAEAFPTACLLLSPASPSEWKSDPIPELLAPGTTSIVRLVLRRNGVAEIEFGFEFAQICSPSGNQCSSSELCFVLACGDSSGGCLDRPTTCAPNYDPVCGCDGVTYANLCEAARSGRSIARQGACTCGGTAGATCSAGYFCLYNAGTCGQAARIGTCSAPTVACPQISQPVCGCNGRTYNSTCEATAAGQSVNHDGACIPQVCGGPTNIRCADTEMFCFTEIGASCAQTGGTGYCKLRPPACPVGFGTVCGCDGFAYSTECRANAVGIAAKSRGPCPAM